MQGEPPCYPPLSSTSKITPMNKPEDLSVTREQANIIERLLICSSRANPHPPLHTTRKQILLTRVTLCSLHYLNATVEPNNNNNNTGID